MSIELLYFSFKFLKIEGEMEIFSNLNL